MVLIHLETHPPRAREMAQWIKALAAKLDNPSSIPGNLIVEREPSPASCPLTSIRTPRHVRAFVHAHYKNKQNRIDT